MLEFTTPEAFLGEGGPGPRAPPGFATEHAIPLIFAIFNIHI